MRGVRPALLGFERTPLRKRACGSRGLVASSASSFSCARTYWWSWTRVARVLQCRRVLLARLLRDLAIVLRERGQGGERETRAKQQEYPDRAKHHSSLYGFRWCSGKGTPILAGTPRVRCEPGDRRFDQPPRYRDATAAAWARRPTQTTALRRSRWRPAASSPPAYSAVYAIISECGNAHDWLAK